MRVSSLEFHTMESSTAPLGASTRPDPGAIRATQIGLLIASLGAVLVVFGLAGLGVVGIFLAVGGAVLAAPAGIGNRWYVAVALGAIVVALSRLIAESTETLGGWLAVAASLSILIGTALGFPARGDRR
jgi:hypothetical protein